MIFRAALLIVGVPGQGMDVLLLCENGGQLCIGRQVLAKPLPADWLIRDLRTASGYEDNTITKHYVINLTGCV
jgi:hypothetical protein